MSRVKKQITIRRITPPKSPRKKATLEEILTTARKLKEAVKKEEKKYGGLGFT